ncbi:MAG TPA: phage holin family protein [Usitatibacter sp.]
MEPPQGEPQSGPLDSLRALGATFFALVGTRAELLVVELREEGERRKEMLVLAGVAAVFLALALLLVAFFIVVLFWDSHRITAIGAVTLLYLGIGAGALARLKAKARASPPPFEASLAELAKDLEMIRARDE